MKDWSGDKNSIFKTLGASSHTEKVREKDDYYATDPKAAELLLELERFNNIWECSCGEGHLSRVFENAGYNVRSSDLVDRGYGETGIDFLLETEKWSGDIITNPPYKYAKEFIEKAIDLIEDGNKVAMFLKIQFLEGKERKKLFTKNPPKIIYVSSSRILCAKNGNFEGADSSAVSYAWFIWEKNYRGDTKIKWFN